jgi:hypothetical protein
MRAEYMRGYIYVPYPRLLLGLPWRAPSDLSLTDNIPRSRKPKAKS